MQDKRLALFLKEFVDEGEAEAIVLALEVNADLLLVDDCLQTTVKLGA